MDQRKSWKWIIFVYGGAVAVVGLVTFFFIAHGATHGGVAIVNGYATATPTSVDVYNGIRPDPESPWIHAKPAVAASPSPTPTPGPSQSPGAHPSAVPSAKLVANENKKQHNKKHAAKEKSDDADADVASAQFASHNTRSTFGVSASQAQGLQATAAPQNPAPAPAATAAPTSAPTAAPTAQPTAQTVAQAPAAPAQNVPIYAPERIVDAQVRFAAQPDFPDADRERGEHGTSVVLVTIDPKGNVVSASVGTSSGYAALDRAAVAAARSSQFVAPKINGHPATETYRVVYDFTP